MTSLYLCWRLAAAHLVWSPESPASHPPPHPTYPPCGSHSPPLHSDKWRHEPMQMRMACSMRVCGMKERGLLISSFTFLPAVNSMVGPPVTSTATHPASCQTPVKTRASCQTSRPTTDCHLPACEVAEVQESECRFRFIVCDVFIFLCDQLYQL